MSAFDLLMPLVQQNDARYPATLLDELRQLALRQHEGGDDDCRFNCPLADNCYPDNVDPTKCSCGAEEHNKKVEQLYQQLKRA